MSIIGCCLWKFICTQINHFHCLNYTFLCVVQFQCSTVRAVEGLVDMASLRPLLIGIDGDSGAVCS